MNEDTANSGDVSERRKVSRCANTNVIGYLLQCRKPRKLNYCFDCTTSGDDVIQRRKPNCCDAFCCVFLPALLSMVVICFAIVSLAQQPPQGFQSYSVEALQTYNEIDGLLQDGVDGVRKLIIEASDGISDLISDILNDTGYGNYSDEILNDVYEQIDSLDLPFDILNIYEYEDPKFTYKYIFGLFLGPELDSETLETLLGQLDLVSFTDNPYVATIKTVADIFGEDIYSLDLLEFLFDFVEAGPKTSNRDIFNLVMILAGCTAVLGLLVIFAFPSRNRGLCRNKNSKQITPKHTSKFFLRDYPINLVDWTTDLFSMILIAPSFSEDWQIVLSLSIILSAIINLYLFIKHRRYKTRKARRNFQSEKIIFGLLIVLSAVEDVVNISAQVLYLIDTTVVQLYDASIKGDISSLAIDSVELIAILLSIFIGLFALTVRIIQAAFYCMLGREVATESEYNDINTDATTSL